MMADFAVTTPHAITWRPASQPPDVKPGGVGVYLVWRRYKKKPGGYVTTADYLNAVEIDEWDGPDDDEPTRTGWHFSGPAGGYDDYYIPANRIEWWAEMPTFSPPGSFSPSRGPEGA
jgi:hypothetical protein